MPNGVTVLVHRLRCVGGTQDERASENGVRRADFSFSNAQTRKSRRKLAVRPRSTLQSLGAFIHTMHSWNNISKDRLTRSRSDYYAPSVERTYTHRESASHGHAPPRLSASLQRLELLGTRSGIPQVEVSAAVCTREPAGARQRRIRSPSCVPSDSVWR